MSATGRESAPDPSHLPDFHRLRVAFVRDEPNDVRVIGFAVPDDLAPVFRFRAGQYLTLRAEVAGREVRRSYSICSAEGEAPAIGVKRIEGGALSTLVHHALGVGDAIDVAPPDGAFGGDPDLPVRNVLCIAAGCGITPVLSILATRLSARADTRATLVYANRRVAEIAFRDALAWLKNRFMARFQWINVLSREAGEVDLLHGRIDADRCAALGRTLVPFAAFDAIHVCGPDGLVADVSRTLPELGIDEARVHCERFFASAEDAREALARQRTRARAHAGLNTRVHVRRGGREVAFDLAADGVNLLDGALAAGLELPYSCKGGVCATCRARVVEGEVEMDLDHALTPAERAAGFVLSCQAHPVSEHVVIDFDARP